MTIKAIEDLRTELRIDEDGLDDCLMQHSEFFYKVARANAEAVGERDQLKLDLENAEVEIDAQLRKKYADNDEKVTETALQKLVRAAPKVMKLHQEHLTAKREADEWSALLSGFQQRSFALGKLVDWKIAQMRNLGIEHKPGAARREYADSVKEAGEAARRRVRRGE